MGVLAACVVSGAVFTGSAPAAAPCVVSSSADSGAGSLREQINTAISGGCTGNTITFQASPQLATITLTSALPPITANVTVDGAGSPVITDITTGGVFLVSSGNVTFDDITVQGLTGSLVDGGAISVNEGSSATVTVENSTFDADTEGTAHNGGAVANLGTGTVDVTNSTFEHDGAASGDGGAIYNGSSGVIQVLARSLLEDDSAENGGAIYNAGAPLAQGSGDLFVYNSSLEDDAATIDGGAVDNGGGAGTIAEALITDDTFVANTAGVNGGAIGNGDGAGSAGMAATGDEFSGNTATSGAGGAIHDGAASLGSDISASTFVGDFVSSAPEGYAIDGAHVTVASDLFVEDCAGTVTSAGYNVAMPASNGGAACAGSGPADQVSGAAGDVGTDAQNSELKVPVYPNPAIDLIPNNTTVTIAGQPDALCPVIDLFGTAGPDSTGHCDAGAIQVTAPNVPPSPPASGPGGSGGSGAGTGATTPPTGTTPPPRPALKKTVTTTVRFDNQTIALVHPSLNVCTAAGKSLAARLTSKAIKHSKKAKLRFRLASFTVGGKDKHTAKRLPAKESIKLKRLKAHATDKLKVVVTYGKPRKHRRAAKVSKSITVKFKIC
jgi:hypothetical protein